MRIKREDTLVIAVDFQERLVHAMDGKGELIKDSIEFLKGIRVLDIPLIVSQQYTKGLGNTIPEIREVIDDDFTLIEKLSFTVYNEENKALIDGMGKKNIIVCGTETHICVLQTAMDLIAAGYNVYMPIDCVGSRHKKDKKSGVTRFIREGGYITSKEAILFELTYSASDEKFKAISKIIK